MAACMYWMASVALTNIDAQYLLRHKSCGKYLCPNTHFVWNSLAQQRNTYIWSIAWMHRYIYVCLMSIIDFTRCVYSERRWQRMGSCWFYSTLAHTYIETHRTLFHFFVVVFVVFTFFSLIQLIFYREWKNTFCTILFTIRKSTKSDLKTYKASRWKAL